MSATVSVPALLVERFLALTPDQQETFMALLPCWHCTVNELLDTVVLLSD